MNEPSIAIVQVTYMELRGSPAPPADRCGSELIARKHPSLRDYLTLYRNVGEPLRWDQGLLMPEAELGRCSGVRPSTSYVLRDLQRNALGLCEFDRSEFPEIELNHFWSNTWGAAARPWAMVPQDRIAPGVEL
jgi:hypothetical protein